MTNAHEFWLRYTPQGLRRTIDKKPLTKSRIETFLRKHVLDVQFASKLDGAALTPVKNGKKCFITIGLNQKQLERERSLVSMMIRGVYRVRSDAVDQLLNIAGFSIEGELEYIVEDVTRKFYTENMGYVRQLYNRLYNKIQNEIQTY